MLLTQRFFTVKLPTETLPQQNFWTKKWQIVSTLKHGKLCRDVKKTPESERRIVWKHGLWTQVFWRERGFISSCGTSGRCGGMIESPVNQQKNSCFSIIIFIIKRSERSLNRKLIRNFLVYSVWKTPSGFFDVLGDFCLSPVSGGLKDPTVPQVCLLPVLAPSLCLKAHRFLFISFVILPSFFLFN